MLPGSGKNSGFNPKTAYLLLILVLCLSSLKSTGQIDIRQYTSATDTFYWKRYTHLAKPPRVNLRRFSVSQSRKKTAEFAAGHLPELTGFPKDSVPAGVREKLEKCLWAVDFNGDKLPDMIFSGEFEGKEMVRIWMNRRDGFDLVFEDYQYISALKLTGNRITGLQTGDIGRDTGYLFFTRDYRIAYEKETPVVIKVRQTVSYRYTEEPAAWLDTPAPFSAVADTLMLRASAARLNEPFFPDLGTFGNIVAKYRNRAKGSILARKPDGKGNVWCFVEMSPAVWPSASILYDTERMPTFIRGWVSAEGIRGE